MSERGRPDIHPSAIVAAAVLVDTLGNRYRVAEIIDPATQQYRPLDKALYDAVISGGLKL
jgi:hypothetical protein